MALISQLQKNFNISSGEDPQWFLCIRVIQDRREADSAKLILIYIDKIANLAD